MVHCQRVVITKNWWYSLFFQRKNLFKKSKIYHEWKFPQIFVLKWKQYSQKSVKNGSKTILSFSHLMEIRWPLPQNTWSMIPEVATIRVNTRNFILIVVNFVVTIIINIFTFREIGEACGIILEIKWSLYLYFVI